MVVRRSVHLLCHFVVCGSMELLVCLVAVALVHNMLPLVSLLARSGRSVLGQSDGTVVHPVFMGARIEEAVEHVGWRRLVQAEQVLGAPLCHLRIGTRCHLLHLWLRVPGFLRLIYEL